MSGGGNQPGNTMALAANAIASGSAGTAGGDTQQASMPQWQKGLLGAATGNPQFGKNAPAIHQLVTQGMGMMNPPQQGMPQHPPMQGAPPGFNAQGMAPPMQGQPGPMQQPGMPPPQQQQSQNPWLQGLNGR